ncbi:MAG: magnesium and cobalt transport protein CorA [Bacteroidetes bacterium]|nr:MAG: magnesium and cobalt transport protein CorA [Bacteroidota bacterium]
MINLIIFDEKEYQVFKKLPEPKALFDKISSDSVNWIDIDSISDGALVEVIAIHFGVHHLVIEDILTVSELPKSEEFENHLFLTFKMLKINSLNKSLEEEHLSMILAKNFLLTFQGEVEGDVFDPIRERIFADKGKVRKQKADYLFYLLIDAVVDNYFHVLQFLREQIEDLEEKIIANPTDNYTSDILALKRKISSIRKVVSPLRDEIAKLKKEPSDFISNEILTYFKDLHDHLNNLMTTFETFREMLAELMDLYLSNLSHSMNTVMKTLTVVASIFIPLTFITGIYGMNFEYIPGLSWRWSYHALMFSMFFLGGSMVYFMKKKNWF